MRRVISKTKQARAGDLVRVSVKMPQSLLHARVSVWSAIGFCDEFSPHTPLAALGVQNKNGRPQMAQSLFLYVSDMAPKKWLEFYADEDMRVRLAQEIDGQNALSCRARIEVYGQTQQTIRRKLANARRYGRDLYDSVITRIRKWRHAA